MGLYVLYVRENYFVVTLVRAEEMLARPKARQLYPPMGHACALELLPVFFYRTHIKVGKRRLEKTKKFTLSLILLGRLEEGTEKLL